MDSDKYLKYLDPRFPLLEKLRIKAPGTYFHSRLVAELGFSVARNLKGVDALLVYLGGLYHDIGKIAKPESFAENQDTISTTNFDSKAILEHVSKGYLLAKSFRLPQAIIAIIRSHHGTAIAPHPNKEVKIRYAGKRPVTAEEALVLLADSIEAAARSQKHESLTRDELRTLVSQVIQSKKIEHQLSMSALQEKDYESIQEDFVQFLDRIYHSRPQR